MTGAHVPRPSRAADWALEFDEFGRSGLLPLGWSAVAFRRIQTLGHIGKAHLPTARPMSPKSDRDRFIDQAVVVQSAKRRRPARGIPRADERLAGAGSDRADRNSTNALSACGAARLLQRWIATDLAYLPGKLVERRKDTKLTLSWRRGACHRSSSGCGT
jgi:hypothetical protein